MRRSDIDRLLARAARLPNGKYRATASRFADGIPLGYFKYYGTRPDDPNDIHPHEHRRELRGSRVFAAWLNHDDSRGLNSLDMLEGPAGARHVRHYMFDFGSIMGSGSVFAQVPRAGNEYILEWAPALKTLVTFGLFVRPWILVDYPEVAPSVGRFEAEFFDPAEWRPEYPNPAFDLMRPDDAFWAARLVAKFSDEALKAIVAKARYSDPAAADYITRTLIARRDKVLRTWLTGVNPIVEPQLSAAGVLTFENAAVSAGVATAPTGYVLTWSRSTMPPDAAVGPSEEQRVTGPRADAPPADPEGQRLRFGDHSDNPSRLSRLERPRGRLFQARGRRVAARRPVTEINTVQTQPRPAILYGPVVAADTQPMTSSSAPGAFAPPSRSRLSFMCPRRPPRRHWSRRRQPRRFRAHFRGCFRTPSLISAAWRRPSR